jgi:hypothetical protein
MRVFRFSVRSEYDDASLNSRCENNASRNCRLLKKEAVFYAKR